MTRPTWFGIVLLPIVLFFLVECEPTETSCVVPPSLWCSTPENAVKCQVYEQCVKFAWNRKQISGSALKRKQSPDWAWNRKQSPDLAWNRKQRPDLAWNRKQSPDLAWNRIERPEWTRDSQQDSEPVYLGLYYESLCPGCRMFIRSQLWPTYQALGADVLNITLVPYGNAKKTKTSQGQWVITCQHGPEECYGNIVEGCAIVLLDKFDRYFPFIYCIENSQDHINVSAPKCAEKLNISWDTIRTCADGQTGRSIEEMMGNVTDSLDPPHTYVPWVTFNGEHTEQMNREAMINLEGLVCQLYKGPKPKQCQTMDYCNVGEV